MYICTYVCRFGLNSVVDVVWFGYEMIRKSVMIRLMTVRFVNMSPLAGGMCAGESAPIVVDDEGDAIVEC